MYGHLSSDRRVEENDGLHEKRKAILTILAFTSRSHRLTLMSHFLGIFCSSDARLV